MEMLKSLGTFKLQLAGSVQTDNAIFKLHYRFTVAVLVVFSILVTTKQYFGDPINCDTSESTKKIRQEVVETFCWINGTYTLRATINDPHTPGLGNDAGHAKIWHAYYQWIAVVLLLQALFFYIPYYLWSIWEGGKMEKLVKDLDMPLMPTTWNEDIKRRLVDYLINFEYLHTLYAFRYFLCEILNFVNTILQLVFINWLLNGEFSIYGISVLNSKMLNHNAFSTLFPKVTNCKYYNYGPSGSIQVQDFLCILPLNVLNEKLFFVLWFWLIFLVIFSFMIIIYRLLLVVIPKFRAYILLAQVRCFDLNQMESIINSINYGSFFVLYIIGKNCSPLVYKELVAALYESTKNIKTSKRTNVIVV